MPASCIGALVLIGLLFVVVGWRHRRHASLHEGACGGAGYTRGHSFRHGGFRGPPFFYRRPLGALLAELDATPGQEKVVRDAIATLLTNAHGTMKETRATRDALGEIVAAPELDQARLQSWLDGHGERLRALGAEAQLALARIHEVLDDEQRKRLSRIVAAGRLGHLGVGHC